MLCKLHPSPSVISLALVLTAVVAGHLTADDSYTEQRARLESMSAEEKEQLQRKKERFDSLTTEEQKRLRELHSTVAATAEADQLLAVMTRYNEWLKTLSSAVRAELLSLPAEERIKRIKEIKQEQERQRFREFANNLPERDMNVVYSWVEDFAVRHQDELLKQVPSHARQRMEQQSETERRRALVTGFMWRRWEDDSLQPTDEDFAELLPKLSEETRRELARATNKEENQQTLRALVRAAVFSKLVPPISDEQRQQVFARLSSVERERLEQMAPDMMRRELTRKYYADQFRERGRDGWRGGGGPPGPGGPRFGPGRRDGDRGGRIGAESGSDDRGDRRPGGGPGAGPGRQGPPKAPQETREPRDEAGDASE